MPLDKARDLRPFDDAQDLRHHAFAIAAEREAGVRVAREWLLREFGLAGADNPDIVVLTYGLFSVEDARGVVEVAAQAPIAGERKAIIIAANRAYREAQNALLKLFEEPPRGTYLFLILPTLGGLLPTLRSRVQVLQTRPSTNSGHRKSRDKSRDGVAEAFIKATREKRGVLAKKLASGKDEDERRENRDEALAIVNGIEAAAYAQLKSGHPMSTFELLQEIQMLRGYLHERSAPVRMILEHLAIVTPRLSSGQAPRNLV